ncbi:MAG: hypothetical protein E6J42_12890 [Chloroflexi bacterium]|nr:MAG: hypothetical protein E6J42_12890 [Chloroflexota bacterium]
MTSRERKILMGILAGFAAFGTRLYFYNRDHMDFFCQEDGFVEYSEAFLYLFAAMFFAYVGAHKGFRNVWYWGYALLFFGVCGEEVSWGQRIFDVATPAGLEAVNLQHETNIHNINGLHQHHHLYGLLVCGVICFAIPLTDRYVPALRNLYRRFNMPVFPFWTSLMPVLGSAFMIVPRLFGKVIFKAFFGFGFSAYREARVAIDPEFVPAPIRAEPAQMLAPSAGFASPPSP